MTFYNISFPRSLIHLVVGRSEEKNIYLMIWLELPPETQTLAFEWMTL